MDKSRLEDLKNKVIDFKRFAFILLSLSGFLSIGLLLPTGALAEEDYLLVIGSIILSIVGAILFHRSAMTTAEKIYEEET